ncbi:flagellar hook-basal body complex protein [Anaerosacchariphilus polymeriproducens]|nr:flagellar hook-basal body complex protein [Anaerosacchariphilus polymeriproducens]
MMRSLYSGVSGLKTHQTKMDVIGNNIANVNTVAFKSSSTTFSEILYQTTKSASGANALTGTGGTNAKQIGLGVTTGATTVNITTAGATQTTGNPFDLKITGDSFFVVSNGSENYFTRDGSFYVDGAGNLCMSSTGYNIMGWQVDGEGKIAQDTVSPLRILAVENLTSDPEATTNSKISGIIDKNSTQVTSETGLIRSLTFYDQLGYSYTAKFSIKSTAADGKYAIALNDIVDSNGDSITKKYGVTLDKIVNFGTDRTTTTSTTKNLTNLVEGYAYANGNYYSATGSVMTNYQSIFQTGTLESGFTYNAPQVVDNTSYNFVGTKSYSGTTGFTDVATLIGATYDSGTGKMTQGLTKAEISSMLFTKSMGAYNLNDAVAWTYDYGTVGDGSDATVTDGTTTVPVSILTSCGITGTSALADGDPVTGLTWEMTNAEVVTALQAAETNPDIAWSYSTGSGYVATHTTTLGNSDLNTGYYYDSAQGQFEQGGTIVTAAEAYGIPADTDAVKNTFTQNADGSITLSTTTKTKDYIVQFNTSTGAFVSVNGEDDVNLDFAAGYGNFKDINMDFKGTTMVDNNGSSTLVMETGDADGVGAGKKLGQMTGVSIQNNGMIYGTYDNGNTKLLGQIATASFANASGLLKEGENLYSATLNSGEFDGIGQDVTADGGSMSSGVLEMSNVDLSAEFTEMITTQRGFQANSRIITTSDSMLEELINLKR